MAAERRTPASEHLAAQLALGLGDQLRLREQPLLVLRETLVAIAVSTDLERVAPLGSLSAHHRRVLAADVDLERRVAAVHDER